MEYDNDKIIKRAYTIEKFYWVFLGVIYPLVYCLTVFLNDVKIWPVLFIVNSIVLPVYFFYSTVIVNRFLFSNRYLLFFVMSLTTIAFIQFVLIALYSLVLQFPFNVPEKTFFTYNYITFIRETLWCGIYMSLSVGICFIKKALDEKDVVINLEKENVSFKLKYFRSQLSPHFLFNTLNSIYSLSLQKSDKTPDVVVRLADLMRYLLYDCNSDKILLSKEIEFIKNYIEIEKIRYKADVRFSVEGDTSGIFIEPFLFISFIENGFKHAFDNTYSNAFIYITIKIEAGQIKLTVINNTNIDLETQAKKIEGTGIRLSKSMLELLYPDAYTLNIIQTDKEEKRKSELRLSNAKKRLEALYPDAHTLDVILSNNAFTVSLILKPTTIDKMYYN